MSSPCASQASLLPRPLSQSPIDAVTSLASCGALRVLPAIAPGAAALAVTWLNARRPLKYAVAFSANTLSNLSGSLKLPCASTVLILPSLPLAQAKASESLKTLKLTVVPGCTAEKSSTSSLPMP